MTAAVTSALPHTRRKVLVFLREYIAEHGYCPSVREIAAGCDLESTSTAVYQLEQLAQAGWIRRAPGRARAIELLNPQDGSDT